MRIFDTHCHISRPEFDPDRAQVVAQAEAEGVSMISVGTSLESSRKCVTHAQKYINVYATVGVHPNDTAVTDFSDMEELKQLAKSSQRVVAIGETGLDYYRDRAAPEVQKKWLEQHLALALELNLPVILHARKSEHDLLDLVYPFIQAGGSAVWHCFTAGKKLLPEVGEKALSMGLMLGIGGVITFEDQQALREFLPLIPDKHLLLETDSPFLNPRPRVSDRNDPLQTVRIAEEVARLRGVTLEDIARVTTRNACAFFRMYDETEEKGKIAYAIRNSLYIALTNDCTNNCEFCARNQSYVVKGHDIKLDHEPSAAEVLAAMGDVSKYDEVVFCGFGEPTMRLEVLKTVAAQMKQQGQTVRLNTNGLSNLYYQRDIVPELVGLVDVVSVSLNTADPAQYRQMCRPRFGEAAYEGMCEFIRACVAAGLKTVCTAVEMPEIDLAAARRKTAELGAEFRARSYVDAG
jgi:TatD DNase family protein